MNTQHNGDLRLADDSGRMGPPRDVPPPDDRHWKLYLTGAIILLAASAWGVAWMVGAWRAMGG